MQWYTSLTPVLMVGRDIWISRALNQSSQSDLCPLGSVGDSASKHKNVGAYTAHAPSHICVSTLQTYTYTINTPYTDRGGWREEEREGE